MNKLSIISILSLGLCLTACNEWTNPIPTTTFVKGDIRYSADPVSINGYMSASCGAGWTKFQGTYSKPVPMDGGDTIRPEFWNGVGGYTNSYGKIYYGTLNSDRIVSDTTAKYRYVCVKD